MIEITHVETFGFETAIRGMRNPYESHEKSDSVLCKDVYPCCLDCPVFKDFGKGHSYCVQNVFHNAEEFVIGKSDMTLAKKLIKAGPEHRKFLRMIHVQCDVLAPRYWWAEMDKYKYVEANSSSTMHLITKKHLTTDDLSLDGGEYHCRGTAWCKLIEEINRLIDEYNDLLRGVDQQIEQRIHQRIQQSF